MTLKCLVFGFDVPKNFKKILGTLELGKIARAYRSDPYLTIPIYARYWYRIRKSHISYDIPDFGDSAGVRAWIWCPLVTIGGSEGLL